MAAERLPNRIIWAFSMPRVAFGIMGTLFGTYLMKFATDVLLIDAAIMGTLIFISRLWDGVSDPMAGYLSDRTRSRFGRRRSWMYCAAIPVGASLFMMWSPPQFLDTLWTIVWMGAALLIYETASTAFFVPHGALGIELSPSYHERTRLFGYSHMISAIGTLLGLISLQFMNSAEDKREFAFLLSLFAGLAVSAIILLSTRYLPERAEFQVRGGRSIVKSFIDVAHNPHVRLLLAVYAIETFGTATVPLLVPYLLEYAIPMKSMLVIILLTYTIPQFIFTPFWIYMAECYGKKNVWLFSFSLTMVTFFLFFPAFLVFREPGVWIWLLAFLLGFGAGAGAVVVPAIQADVLDWDELKTGERKEGTYFSIANLVRKTAASVAALVTGLALSIGGFVPNAPQSESTQYIMVGLFSLLPATCFLVGIALLARFSFNKPEHDAVRRQLESNRDH